MNILISNDDGVHSSGIIKLAKEISKIANVAIVAPDRERSATAHAITMHKPLRVDRVNISDLNVDCWKVNGTPSDCVKLGLEALLDFEPDMVLSGINSGPNLGTDVMYSGTVSAAIEAAIAGIPAIAFSVASYENITYDYSAEFAKNLCLQLKEHQFPDNLLLNVNIPIAEKKDIKGVYVTYLGSRRYKNSFEKRIDPRGKVYYWLAGELIENYNQIGSDVWAVKNKYISVSPIHFDLTRHDIIDTIKKWNLKP